MSTPDRTPVPDRFNAAAFFLDRHVAEGRGARTAFRHRARSISYARVADRANRCGNALAGLGVRAEQRVLLALPDGPEFAEAFWGALKLGAVAVPVNPGLRAEEYLQLLRDGRMTAAVAAAPALDAILSARAGAPWLASVVAVRDADAAGAPGAAAAGALDYEALLAAASPALAAADTHRDDAALWGYTSGSTGAPKAAVHAHRDLVCAADLVGVGTFGIGPDDRILSVSKLYFAYGLGNSLYFPARVGAAAILVPGRLEPEGIFELIAAERPTCLFAVPTVYARLLEVPGRGPGDLGALRLCVSSGEALAPRLFHQWQDRFGVELLDVVGSTEALHDFIANRPGRARAGSSGEVIPGFEARLVDGDGRPVLPGNTGELLVKGDSTASGYWNRREQTRRTMVGEWLRTGDMFYQDTEGYFFFGGRTDDMLKVGGMWVSPVEVESCLLDHPAVLEVAVIGRRDTDGLTRAHAYCVLAAGAAAGPDLAAELTQHVRRRLAGYKAPRWVDFVAELPKTPTGKIQRFRLRAPAR